VEQRTSTRAARSKTARAVRGRRVADQRLYGSLKRSTATGGTKVRLKLEYRTTAARSRPPAIWYSSKPHGGSHGLAKSLQELWSFNMGTGINAPAVTYAVNGKQYVAVLVGSRQALNVWQHAPELKNTATASMLYVFEQQ
jgi:alcohol dehydrogenase (cytochrome c)